MMQRKHFAESGRDARLLDQLLLFLHVHDLNKIHTWRFAVNVKMEKGDKIDYKYHVALLRYFPRKYVSIQILLPFMPRNRILPFRGKRKPEINETELHLIPPKS